MKAVASLLLIKGIACWQFFLEYDGGGVLGHGGEKYMLQHNNLVMEWLEYLRRLWDESMFCYNARNCR